jgi:sugar porter (SP) family MFS transporter
MPKNTYLFFCALVAALGGLLFGFDTAVISGAEQALKNIYTPQYESLALHFGSINFWHGFLVASALIGTIIGALVAGQFADRYGRRAILRWLGIIFIVSAVGSGLAWGMWSFFWFRLLAGLGVGAASVVATMYIAEISPAHLRGRLVAMTQFNIVSGILLAFLSNYIIAGLNLSPDATWRWMFAIAAFPSVLFFVLLYFVPRSPRWLMTRNLRDEAAAALKKLGTDHGSVAEELNAIAASLKQDVNVVEDPLFQRRYARPILLAFAIAMFNQLSGINALMYFAPRIFEMAGFAKEGALLSSVGVGAMNLVFTMAALVIIDHFGRRKLMLVGSVGYIISLSATAWAFYKYGTSFSGVGSQVVLWSLFLFIASHAFGQGAVILAFISEIFPNRLRARGQALGLTTHWVMAAAISWTFPMFAERSGGNTFAFYALCMVGQLVWVLVVMPETKGVPLEDMEKQLGITR